MTSDKQVVGGKVRKYYLATEAGKAALTEALVKVRELMNEVEDQSRL
jgi:DNA-binding PadR family transcriptional regulator